ncbi:hypothetical protein BV25DRAFT_1987496 [Artomyces pyxidatus]|uniref:Uncharacterized protein n=1 Tax=Artomyces pyxidatus TaxID=48021 RepID=A0ACB8THH2_9AGAM|nr:hypothetical protein BV25DRAFT_1987496 [Artomyces pyxidatus]
MVKKPVIELDSEDEVFHVEVVTGARLSDDAVWEYHVKWAGYGSDADSWEPEENISSGCDRLLSSFWDHVGIDNGDYEIGYNVRAHQSWIKKERAFFAKTFGKAEDLKKKKDKKKARRRKHHGFSVSKADAKPAKNKVKAQDLRDVVKKINSSVDPEDSDDVPLSTLASQTTTPSVPSEERHNQDSSESESDDAPLANRFQAAKNSIPRGTKLGSKRKAEAISGNAQAGPSKSSSTEPPRKVLKTEKDVHPRPSKLRIPSSPTAEPEHAKTPTSATQSPDSPTSLFSGEFSQPSQPPTPAKNTQDKPNPPISQPPAARKPSYAKEPKVKMMDPPNLTSGSTLATKQLLGPGQGATGPRAALKHMRIPKKKPTELPADNSTGAQPPAPPTSTTEPLHDTPDDMDIESPIEPPDQRPDVSNDQTKVPGRNAAERFLAKLNLDLPNLKSVHAKSTAPSSVLSGPKRYGTIPKLWKWVGDLFVDIQKDHAERICNVKLSKPTEHADKSLRFSICFHSVDSLRLGKWFPVANLHMIRPALGPVAQTCQLGPDDDKDSAPVLKAMANRMASNGLMSSAPLYLDNFLVAELLVFPSTYADLCKEFNVRADVQGSGFFVAALVPWSITGEKARALRRVRSQADRDLPPYKSEDAAAIVSDPTRSVRQSTRYHRALDLLKFPEWLHSRSENLAYCIWHHPAEGNDAIETSALNTILSRQGAQDVGFHKDVGVIFVHVGALSSLPKLYALAERRFKQPNLQFIMYGTHHKIPPERWGIREIYPIGGIVTFTPSAFQDYPLAVHRLMSMIERHPLWQCFVVPSVVAMAATQSHGPDPVTEFERDTFAHAELLTRLAEGDVALVRKPPHGRSKAEPVEAYVKWLTDFYHLQPRTILERCMREFTAQFAELPKAKWPSAVLDEISATVLSMQMQPCIMDRYRRFVVVTGKKESVGVYRDGLEWSPVSEFDFREDFFEEREMRALKSLIPS